MEEEGRIFTSTICDDDYYGRASKPNSFLRDEEEEKDDQLTGRMIRDPENDTDAPEKYARDSDMSAARPGEYKTGNRGRDDQSTKSRENAGARARVIQKQREVAMKRRQISAHHAKMVMRKADGPMTTALLSTSVVVAGATNPQRTRATTRQFSAPKLVVDETSNSMYSTNDRGSVGGISSKFLKGDIFDEEHVPESGRTAGSELFVQDQRQKIYENQPTGKRIVTSTSTISCKETKSYSSDTNRSITMNAGGSKDWYERDPYDSEMNNSFAVTRRQETIIENSEQVIETNLRPDNRPYPSKVVEENMSTQSENCRDCKTLGPSKPRTVEGCNDHQHPHEHEEYCNMRSDENSHVYCEQHQDGEAPKGHTNQSANVKNFRRTKFKRSSSNLSSLVSDHETKSSEVEEEGHRKNSSAYVEKHDRTADDRALLTLDGDKLSDPNTMKTFLMSPCAKQAGSIQCYVKRNRSGANTLFPEYSVFLKEGDIFLMTSKKRTNSKTSNYLISMEQNDHDRESDFILGKLRANFLGTEFQIYDAGISPAEYYQDIGGTGNEIVGLRSELGAITYESNVIRSRGPRKMQACIANFDDNDVALRRWQPLSKGDEMMAHFKKKKDDGGGERANNDLLVFGNRPPEWNEKLGAYSLNFNGRVTMASVKNFQLVEPHNDDNIILQFGRVAKDEFTMDCRWPLSPFQAFAITLSSFDSKIACE